jgi:hypothetical protein
MLMDASGGPSSRSNNVKRWSDRPRRNLESVRISTNDPNMTISRSLYEIWRYQDLQEINRKK